jgi:hypothetical protein
MVRPTRKFVFLVSDSAPGCGRVGRAACPARCSRRRNPARGACVADRSGRLAALPRRNCWTIAEHARDTPLDDMQHLLARPAPDDQGVPAAAAPRGCTPETRTGGPRSSPRAYPSRPGSAAASNPAPSRPRAGRSSTSSAPASRRHRGHVPAGCCRVPGRESAAAASRAAQPASGPPTQPCPGSRAFDSKSPRAHDRQAAALTSHANPRPARSSLNRQLPYREPRDLRSHTRQLDLRRSESRILRKPDSFSGDY